MSASTIDEKRRVTLPRKVCEAAGLRNNDQVDWRFEDGEIRGRKLVPQPGRERIYGRLVERDRALVLELPKGFRVDLDSIAEAVREDRKSR
jgi:bifunctional DNA-binding transcriptional regulator/antitoxin component of YhaV-PrlF toxin-antitoxin module